VHVEQAEADRAGDRTLQRRQHGEGERVAEQQVELGEGQRHQPLERAAGAFTQHRDRGDQEHHDQREEADQRRADAVERLRLVVEDELEQR
jgi:hypothetical protein